MNQFLNLEPFFYKMMGIISQKLFQIQMKKLVENGNFHSEFPDTLPFFSYEQFESLLPTFEVK